MPRERRNRGEGRRDEYWTREEMEELVALAQAGKSALDIAKRMLRTPKSIRSKASRIGVPIARKSTGRPDIDPRLRRIVVTAEFDITSLSVEERRALAARLLEGLPACALNIPKPYEAGDGARAWWLARRGPLEERPWYRKMLAEEAKMPSRRQRRREKRARKLDAWYRRQFASAVPTDREAKGTPRDEARRADLSGYDPERTAPNPSFDPFDEEIDFGPDSQPSVFEP